MTGYGTREWDAGTYDRVSTPQLEWSEAVLDRLELSGEETVLDAGCGSGRVTERLAERLPAGRVVAVDGSAAMLAAARRRLGGHAELICSDLLELELGEPVDAVFSNAVFHWIADHDRLFGRLAACLAPGGRLEAQCGGAGNVARFTGAIAVIGGREPFRPYLEGFEPTFFAGAEETAERLERSGFVAVRCWLEPRPVVPPQPREFIRSVCLGAHSELLPRTLREPLLEAVLAELGPRPELDYVRLNISARRGAAG